MTLYGLTGGIGAGKSAAAQFIAQTGVPVVDTDLIAREIVAPGQPALAEIRQAFGDHVIGPGGDLLRDVIAREVFASAEARGRLEKILHPLIRERWLHEIGNWKTAGVECGVVVIPLLYETGAESEFDAVICIACSPAVQLERLKSRGWADLEIRRRLDAQWPMSRKMDAADYVAWNDSPLPILHAQLKRILEPSAP